MERGETENREAWSLLVEDGLNKLESLQKEMASNADARRSAMEGIIRALAEGLNDTQIKIKQLVSDLHQTQTEVKRVATKQNQDGTHLDYVLESLEHGQQDIQQELEDHTKEKRGYHRLAMELLERVQDMEETIQTIMERWKIEESPGQRKTEGDGNNDEKQED